MARTSCYRGLNRFQILPFISQKKPIFLIFYSNTRQIYLSRIECGHSFGLISYDIVLIPSSEFGCQENFFQTSDIIPINTDSVPKKRAFWAGKCIQGKDRSQSETSIWEENSSHFKPTCFFCAPQSCWRSR